MDFSVVKFLIIDDNAFMRTIIRRLLSALGSTDVREASDGAEAFKLMTTFVPDIIIVDWEMQPLDGIDFTRMLRTGSDSPNPFVPIIMVTGHSEHYRVTEARDAGINELLVKPLSAKALFTRIHSVIERPRPFIKTRMYFGPDRRRKSNIRYNGPERRKSDD